MTIHPTSRIIVSTTAIEAFHTFRGSLLHRWRRRLAFDLIVFFALVNLFEHATNWRTSTMTTTMFVAAEHRVSSYRRMQTINRPPCATRADCPYDNAFCNVAQRKCQCKFDYVQVTSFVNKSYISHQSMNCLPVARLDERCASDNQCIVENSECTETRTTANVTNHHCKCSPGHEVDDHDTAEVILSGNAYRTKPNCVWERSHGGTWLSTLIIVSLLLICILIGTFVALVRYQRWRNQSFPATVTSLASSPRGGMNAANSAGNNHMISGSPPPMGSVEAEFQNDFIQVFPMHHLEPMPDKNAHAFVIR